MNRRELFSLGGKIGLVGLSTMVPWKIFEQLGMVDSYFAEASSLPQNYQIAAGTQWLNSSLASLTSVDATGGGDATITVTDSTDTQYLRPAGATNVLKVSITAPGTVTSFVSLTWTINDVLSDVRLFGFPVWSNLSTWTNVSHTIYFMKNNTFGTRMEFLSTSALTPVNMRENGWSLVQHHRDDTSNAVGGVTIADTYNRARIVISVPAGVTGTFYIGPVYRNMAHRTKVAMTFDDAIDDQYNIAYAYMQPRGMAGGIGINSDSIGTAGKMTLSQLQEVQAAGWTIHNHTASHVDMATAPTAQSDVQRCHDYMQSNGLSSGRGVFIAPFGSMNDTANSVIASLGYTHCYMTGEKIAKYWDGLPDPYRIYRSTLDNVTASAAITRLNWALKYGSGLVYFGHDIDTVANSSTMATAELRLLCDHLYRLWQANVIDLVDPVHFITGATNPRHKRIV